MARVAILNGGPIVARILDSLRQQGHEVLTASAPIDFERLIGFIPEVIVVGLVRTCESRPIQPEAGDGYEAVHALEGYPALITIPIILLGSGLSEGDVPGTLCYDWFLEMPGDVDGLTGKISALAGKVRSRHKRGDYFCPQCHARLVCVYGPQDLFCLRCGTAVTIEGEACDALTGTGQRIPCSLDHLKPPKRRS